jgi:hypothetical protein
MPPARPADHRRRGLALAAATAVLVGGASVACGGDQGGGADGEQRRLVYVSGLDDHLLPAYDTVPVHREPGGPVVAESPVDVLAWVHGRAGEWLEVALAEPGPAGGAAPASGTDPVPSAGSLRGWVADYYLRGELHLVDPEQPGCPVPAADLLGDRPRHRLDPSTRVGLVDLAQVGPQVWVQVRQVRGEGEWWVLRQHLSERPGPDIRRAEPGTGCEAITPDPVASHTH